MYRILDYSYLKRLVISIRFIFFIAVRYCIEPCNDRSEIIIVKDNKNSKKWASCLPMLGTLLTQVGHAACPKWARFMPKTETKVFMEFNARNGYAKQFIYDDVSMEFDWNLIGFR